MKKLKKKVSPKKKEEELHKDLAKKDGYSQEGSCDSRLSSEKFQELEAKAKLKAKKLEYESDSNDDNEIDEKWRVRNILNKIDYEN